MDVGGAGGAQSAQQHCLRMCSLPPTWECGPPLAGRSAPLPPAQRQPCRPAAAGAPGMTAKGILYCSPGPVSARQPCRRCRRRYQRCPQRRQRLPAAEAPAGSGAGCCRLLRCCCRCPCECCDCLGGKLRHRTVGLQGRVGARLVMRSWRNSRCNMGQCCSQPTFLASASAPTLTLPRLPAHLRTETAKRGSPAPGAASAALGTAPPGRGHPQQRSAAAGAAGGVLPSCYTVGSCPGAVPALAQPER